jgi:hypothetical protein
LAGGESNLQPGWINDQFPLPQGQYQQYNPNNYSGQITGGENSTFFPGSGGIPNTGGGPDTPGDTTSDPSTGPTDSGSKDPSQVIHDLGYDPGDPRNFDPSGFGSGRPTQKAIGLIGNFLGNFAFPGLGMLTGPVASKITQMIQNGASRSAVQNAIAKAQGGGGDVSVGAPTDVSSNAPSGGSPYGGMFSGLPEGFTEGNRFGGGAPTFEGPGFTGPSWSAGGSIFGGRMNPNMNLAGSWNNIGASGGGLAPGMANLYLHGQGMQNWAQGQGYNSVGDWLRQTGFSLGGANPSGAGLSGAGRPMTSSR